MAMTGPLIGRIRSVFFIGRLGDMHLDREHDAWGVETLQTMLAGMLQRWLAYPCGAGGRGIRYPAAHWDMCLMSLMRWPSLVKSDYPTGDLAATLPNRTGRDAP